MHPAATRLTGTVREDGTRRQVAGADVWLEGHELRTRTAENGKFEFSGLKPDRYVLNVRMVGFRAVKLQVDVDQNADAVQDVLLVPVAVRLDSIAVTESVPLARGMGSEEFEARRRMGFGKFIDSEELRRNEHRNLGDMLRSIQGVNIVTPPLCSMSRRFNCVNDRQVRVAVGRGVLRDNACIMQVLLDSRLLNKGGRVDWEAAFDLNSIPVREVENVEVYRSASEVPGEFSGASSACGVLVLWSRH